MVKTGRSTDMPTMALILLFAVFCLGCKDEGTPPSGYRRSIELAVEDYGTTDAWLRVRFSDAPPYAFRLLRDGQTVLSVNSSPTDTLVADETPHEVML